MQRYRKDNCQNPNVDALIKMGAGVEVQSSKAVGYDCLVSLFGILAMVEWKNKITDKLSENETRIKQKFPRHYIVATDALQVYQIMSGMAVRF